MDKKEHKKRNPGPIYTPENPPTYGENLNSQRSAEGDPKTDQRPGHLADVEGGQFDPARRTSQERATPEDSRI
jgi:hypothetical protein